MSERASLETPAAKRAKPTLQLNSTAREDEHIESERKHQEIWRDYARAPQPYHRYVLFTWRLVDADADGSLVDAKQAQGIFPSLLEAQAAAEGDEDVVSGAYSLVWIECVSYGTLAGAQRICHMWRALEDVDVVKLEGEWVYEHVPPSALLAVARDAVAAGGASAVAAAVVIAAADVDDAEATLNA